MLNYILPPIIIIVCTAILIRFLFKKANEIPQHELEMNEMPALKKQASVIFAAAGQFGLKILERVFHRAKLMSLKFHNTSNVWFQSIREKRQQKQKQHEEALEKQLQEKAIEDQDIEQEPRLSQPIYPQNSNQEIASNSRPMIRETVTRPQPKALLREKNQMEAALIKRIAINPKDIEAYERLGDYYLESNNPEDSLECFKQVLKLSPSHQKARMRVRRLEKVVRG